MSSLFRKCIYFLAQNQAEDTCAKNPQDFVLHRSQNDLISETDLDYY